jgi:MFS family permease
MPNHSRNSLRRQRIIARASSRRVGLDLVAALASRVRLFFTYQAASSFAIWIPFWALWIRSNVSSDFEFTLADVAFWVGLLVFQLPVGVVADRTSRKRSIVLSELFRSAGILGYGLGTTLWAYVAANVVWSLGAAFSVGTSAYLYETLLEAGHESEFPRYIGRGTMIQLLSNASGAFAGGLFVRAVGDIRLTLLVGAAVNLVAVAIAFQFREPRVERSTEPTYAQQLVQGLRVVRRREGVALLIGLEVFLGVTLYAMAIFRPLYLQFLGFSNSDIAVWISGFLLVAALWSAFAGRIAQVLGEFGTLVLMVFTASAAFFGMYGTGQFPGAVLFQVPIYIVWSLQPALTTAFLNRRLEPGQRATVLSMGAFAYTLGLVVVEPVAGWLTTSTGLLNLGLFLGVVTFFPCAYVLARWRTSVAAWPPITPVPSRLVAGGRVSRFHRLLERMSRLRP